MAGARAALTPSRQNPRTDASRVQDRTGEATSGRQRQPVYVTRVEVVCKQTLWNYQARTGALCHATCPLLTPSTPAALQPDKTRAFLKIFVALPNMVTVARGVLEKGITIPCLSSGQHVVLPTIESNVLFILRFMVDCKVRASSAL